MLNLLKYHKLDKHQRMNTDHVASGKIFNVIEIEIYFQGKQQQQ